MEPQITFNGHSGKSIDELTATYIANKRPGRPSKEQRELGEVIMYMQQNGMSKLPKKPAAPPPMSETSTLITKGEAPKTLKRKTRIEPLMTDSIEPAVDEAPKKKGKTKVVKDPEAAYINIPRIEVARISVVVEGTEILITHAWDVKSKRQIEEKQQGKARGARGHRDPDAEFNAARYVDRNGIDCVPARCFKNAIVEATTFCEGLTKKLVRGAIYVKGDLLPILGKNGKPIKPVLRDDMVRIGGMSKTADIRYRPQYDNWKVKLDIEFATKHFTPDMVVNLVNLAGFHVGVCEWRPTYGRFEVVS